MNSGYSEPPDIVNFLPGPFEFTIMRVHCMYNYYTCSMNLVGTLSFEVREGMEGVKSCEVTKCNFKI